MRIKTNGRLTTRNGGGLFLGARLQFPVKVWNEEVTGKEWITRLQIGLLFVQIDITIITNE